MTQYRGGYLRSGLGQSTAAPNEQDGLFMWPELLGASVVCVCV